jgi:hypothetical protein
MNTSVFKQAQQLLNTCQWPEVDAKPNALASLSLTPWHSGALSVVCIHPWNIGQWAGKDRCCDYWLTSQAALTQLNQPLTDITDKQQAVVLMITGLTLEAFAEQLALAATAFPCAELDFCVRQAKHLAALPREQMHIQTSERQLTRKTTTDRIRALKPAFHLQRSAGAIADAFASDKPPHELAQAFKQKRINAYQQALEALAALKAPALLSHAYLVDSGQALASIAAPNPNHPLALALAFVGTRAALNKLIEALAL